MRPRTATAEPCRFEYLKYGLSAILVFVGGKMLLAGVIHVPTPLSLLVISAAVGLSILASVLYGSRNGLQPGEGEGEG